ncbi:MAG: alkaline phosphatase family protein [Deltaproteobacteria bacterium]|nr:alkaline phosphatase family protein [Deltaproteobacteria bacterium]
MYATVLATLASLAAIVLPLMHGFSFMDGFNAAPPAELAARRTTPAAVEPSGRTVLVVVDGLRLDRLPLLGLDRAPAWRRAACTLETVLPSFSRPAYVALSTGVPPALSGVHTNDHEGPARLESLWELARRAGLTTHLLADGTDWWVELFPEAFTRTLLVPKADFVRAVAAEGLGARDVLLLHWVAADDEAHDFGVGPAYDDQVRAAGALVRDLMARLDPARDVVLVTADHGHIDRGGHGGPEPEVMTVPLVAFGRGITDAPSCRGSIVDVPATVAALIGLPPPAANAGRALPMVASPGPASAFAPPAAPPPRAGSPWGMALGIALVAGALVLAARRPRPALIALTWPAVAVLVYALVEPTLSLSAVWLEDPWLEHMVLVLGLPALVVAVVVFGFVLRPEERWVMLLPWSLAAVLPLAAAVGFHGSLDAGPRIGDPHGAFGLLVSDLVAALGVGAALVVAAVLVVSSRLRRPAGGAPAGSAS